MGNHNLDDSKIARSVLGYLRGLMGKSLPKGNEHLICDALCISEEKALALHRDLVEDEEDIFFPNSNFYLKHCGSKVYITDENVYTVCPQCGKEHRVNLHDVFTDGDLCSTQVYCPSCSKKMDKRKKEGDQNGVL